MRILLSIFATLVFYSIPCTQASEWEAISSLSPQSISHKISITSGQMLIQVQIPGFYKEWIENENSYEIFTPGMGQNIMPGSPRLPFISYVLAIPNENSNPVIDISCKSSKAFPKISILKNACTTEEYNGFEPKSGFSNVELHEQNGLRFYTQRLGKLRGTEILKLTVHPFEVDSLDEIIVRDRFAIQLNLPEGWQMEEKSPKRCLQPFKNQILNVAQEDVNANDEIPDEYLIITPSQFITELQPLIAWRMAEGMVVTVKTIEQIKKEMQITNLLSADKLQEYLSLYFNKQPNLVYVLLVGDVEFIPVKYKNDDGTDLYYSFLDGIGDMVPDIYLGRFPVNNAEEVASIVEKTIAYEKALPSKKVLLGAHFQDVDLDGVSDRDYIQHSEEFRTFLLKRQYVCQRVYTKTPGSNPAYYSDHTPIPKDITFEGCTQDIVNFINTGAAIVNHRGHGDINGWTNPSFQVQDIEALWNHRYPIMFNIDSDTGKFDLETEQERRETEGSPLQSEQESFSERLLALKKRGPVAIIAPSRNTISSVNNVFNKGLMEAVWPKMYDSCDSPATRLAQVLLRGRIKVIREFGGSGWMNDKILGNFHHYHLLGDPALRIRQEQ